MKIKKSEIKSLVKQCINEAMKYDKERRQYFPDYTGNRHSDAGKYADDYKDDFNYTRNDYKWHNKANQDRFNRLQFQKDLEIDPTNPDRENEGGAESYMDEHDADTIVSQAVEDLTPVFNQMLEQFAQTAKERYPIFKDDYYLRDLVWNMKDVLSDFGY